METRKSQKKYYVIWRRGREKLSVAVMQRLVDDKGWTFSFKRLSPLFGQFNLSSWPLRGARELPLQSENKVFSVQ